MWDRRKGREMVEGLRVASRLQVSKNSVPARLAHVKSPYVASTSPSSVEHSTLNSLISTELGPVSKAFVA